MSSVLARAGDLGDGRIDNWIIDASVHVTTGIAVLVTMTIAAGWILRLALVGATLDRIGRWTLVVAQVVLGLQILLGIKLLDQGQGIGQLYIHYVGGLLPMGAFLAGGWFARGDSPRSTRVLAALVTLGWLSATMAFVIGRAYVNR
ncbi:MAG: hypothetical protein AAFZ07_07605 [Actinomycetota bacterium]